MKLILASSSIYRRNLLAKLGVEFTTMATPIDEEQIKNTLLNQKQSALTIAETLSLKKAETVFAQHPQALIIAGDQLVHFQGQILGKPHTFERALQQLSLLNNATHELITSITLMSASQTIKYNHITELKMKNLSQNELSHYLQKDTPYDCAGSYKIEESGIVLFKSINCDDFTAIQGIPMIWLSQQLKEMNYEFFKN